MLWRIAVASVFPRFGAHFRARHFAGHAFSGEAPTACRHTVSGTLSLPSSGCFSPFHHCTGSLSVDKEYLGLDRGRPTFRQGFTCPALLKDVDWFTHTGLSPAMAQLSRWF